MVEQCVSPTCKPFIPPILINSITCLHYCDDLSLRERCQANLSYTCTMFLKSVTISIHSIRLSDLSHPDKRQPNAWEVWLFSSSAVYFFPRPIISFSESGIRALPKSSTWSVFIPLKHSNPLTFRWSCPRLASAWFPGLRHESQRILG